MKALWGEPWTARSVFVDGNEVVPFRGDVKDLWLLAKQCTVRRSEGKARSREDGMVVSPRVLTRTFRCWGFDRDFSHWLFSQCFHAPSPSTAEEVSRSTAIKVESGISDANHRSLVSALRVNSEQTLAEKSRSGCLNWGQMNTRCSGWRNQEQKKIFSRNDACARALFFVSSPTASGVQLPFETNSILDFFHKSFFTSHSHTRAGLEKPFQ